MTTATSISAVANQLSFIHRPAGLPDKPVSRMARGSSNLAGGGNPEPRVANILWSFRSPNWLGPMSTDEMIAHLGSCRARPDLAALVEALSQHPWLNTPVETKRLDAARAAMANWKAYSQACQARHNAHRLRRS
jgi:hypothetical protein